VEGNWKRPGAMTEVRREGSERAVQGHRSNARVVSHRLTEVGIARRVSGFMGTCGVNMECPLAD
jgi:hypothetical protein